MLVHLLPRCWPVPPRLIGDLVRALGWQLKKYFTFEVQVLDDKNVRRRFRASNYQVCATPHGCSGSGCARLTIGRRVHAELTRRLPPRRARRA